MSILSMEQKINIMALNPRKYHCPIFKKTIEDGLCWEICYAESLITKEDVPELMEYIKENNITVEEVQNTFCRKCNFCQWDKNKY